MMRQRENSPRSRHGFTIVELMVSMALLGLLFLVLTSMTDAIRKTWTFTSGKVEQFRGARDAFDSLTRKISQATLNTYWDYDNPDQPTRYVRHSELRFLSGGAASLTGKSGASGHALFFQAPLGFVNDTARYSESNTLLNTWGYFVEFGDDSQSRPPFITQEIVPPRHRFRLFEMMEPSEALSIYRHTNANPAYTGHEWFTDPLRSSVSRVRPVAENIVTLVLLPRLSPEEDPSGTSLAGDYHYDSTSTKSDPAINPKNQLPPVMQVTILAVDEASYSRYQERYGSNMPGELSGLPVFREAGDIEDASKPGYAQDLRALQDVLRGERIDCRVFTTNVNLKGAKWSREQGN